MAYKGSDSMPMERASKIGHIKMINDSHLQRLIAEFESSMPTNGDPIGECSGHIDLNKSSEIRYVIAIDGGEAIVPNQIRSEKQAAFLSICAMLIRISDIEEMKNSPIIDPRDLFNRLKENVWYSSSMLPLSGIRIPGQTVKDSIRKAIDSTLYYTGLYDTLKFLVSREWDPAFQMGSGDAPHFFCRKCGDKIYVPKSQLAFRCPQCNYPHTLADYLGIAEESYDEWAREETVKSFRNSLEVLTLFHFLRIWRFEPNKLRQILFVRDGPLMLRATLYRLVDSINAFITYLFSQNVPFYIIGVEKTGEIVNHIDEIKRHLVNTGDYFLPSVPYIIENINGYAFNEKTYRNRVQFGAKIVVRIGNDHILPLNIPTCNFLLYPKIDDLIGLNDSLITLTNLTTYRYENAIIPLILANEYASISEKPSGDILHTFVTHFLS